MNQPDKRLIRKMTARISHRGPDQDGIFVDDAVSLGHRRLSIIDLSERGRQPMHNENEDVWIVFNGEIYNHQGMRQKLEARGHRYSSRSDTETIIHGYEEYGDKIVEQMNGDFAFCIYDSNKKKFFLARDRLGVKPLYYYYNKKNKLFAFASEIKALLEHPQIPRAVHLGALHQYLTYRYVFSPQTILQHIYRLQPAHTLTYDLKTNELKIQKYWDVNSSPTNILHCSEAQHTSRYRDLLVKSTERRLMSDVPLGVYLSGGMDSSSVVATLSHVKKMHEDSEPIRSFSIGFSEGISELPYARAIADKFHTNHTEIIMESDAAKLLPYLVYHMDEPVADPAQLPTYVLSQHTKKSGVTVILTGDGGDETLAGYEQIKFIKFAQPLKFIPKQFRTLGVKLAMNTLPAVLKDKIFKYASKLGDIATQRAVAMVQNVSSVSHMYKTITGLFSDEEIRELSTQLLPETDHIAPYLPPETHNVVNHALAFETKALLPEHMLMKSDKMCMAWGIEGRVPLLDHELVEYTFRMPTHMKLKFTTEKYVLRKAMQPWLPKNILQRGKQRFYVPIDLWLTRDLSSMTDSMLSPDILRQQGFFNQAAVKKIRENYNKAPLYYARQLWTLLTFQVWHELFLEGKKAKEFVF
ncbi:MAG: asparagine synthase (glutamine-hydrolyzing) [Candidatus Aenigmarchaeota archaeon]|nr:asparagine synthase (glutamine-hydrolyzing) [Candidatus Aenigmarchaeota archaeon]